MEKIMKWNEKRKDGEVEEKKKKRETKWNKI